jgi:hypothetical protein
MSNARCWLYQCSIDVSQVVEFEDSVSRVCCIFGESSIYHNAMGYKVLAKELISSSAVVAISADFRVISYNTIPERESHNFAAEGCDDADCFVTWYKGELEAIVSGTERKKMKR